MNKETFGAITGTSMSAVGTSIQTNDVLQTISLIITIIGGLITITMALVNWWKKASEDGKISKEELKEGVDILVDGGKALNDSIKDKEEK